jgi:hypothetical protein
VSEARWTSIADPQGEEKDVRQSKGHTRVLCSLCLARMWNCVCGSFLGVGVDFPPLGLVYCFIDWSYLTWILTDFA